LGSETNAILKFTNNLKKHILYSLIKGNSLERELGKGYSFRDGGANCMHL